jgi:hypothetical protein
MNHFKLFTIAGAVYPFSLHGNLFTRRRGENGSNHGYKIAAVVDLYLGDGVAVFFIKVGYPFYLSLEIGEHGESLFSHTIGA